MKDFVKMKGMSALQSEDQRIIREIEDVLEKINNDYGVISPKSLINNINSKFSFEYDQQDSYELYHRLLEIMEDKNNSVGSNPFSISLVNKFKCKTCGNTIEKKEKALDISITADHSNYSISSMIQGLFKEVEIEDYTCVKCTLKNVIKQIDNGIYKSKEVASQNEILKEFLVNITKENIYDDLETMIKRLVEFTSENGIMSALDKKNLRLVNIKSNLIKTSQIKEYPQILTIHINKVFFIEEAVTTSKLKVIFPEILKFPEAEYQLTSFIEHLGTHSSGHYIAYRKFYEKWILLNDSNIRLIETRQAFSVSNPYMLFYRKMSG